MATTAQRAVWPLPAGDLVTEVTNRASGSVFDEARAPEVLSCLLGLEEAKGYLKAEDVVEEARNPSSVLHGMFEWDDTRAAKLHRLETAGKIIRSVRYRVSKLDGEERRGLIPAFVSVRVETPAAEKRAYVSIGKVVETPRLRRQVQAEMARALQGIADRYAAFEELSRARELVTAAIQALADS